MSDVSNMTVIDPGASLGENVKVGPFCVIGPDVEIGDDCELISHVSIEPGSRIGKGNVFYPNAVIGAAPQDLKYKGGATQTIIGDRNVFREFSTVHRGTELGGGKTVIGSGNLIMVGSHIAHDCVLEDNILLANQTQLAGHVHIEQGAVVSALVGLHHFVRVGRFSYIGGMTPVRRDVPPFMKFSGDPNEVRGVNEQGLIRHGFEADTVAALKQAYRKLFRRGSNIAADVAAILSEKELDSQVRILCEFVQQTCQSRFGRYLENFRTDQKQDRMRNQ